MGINKHLFELIPQGSGRALAAGYPDFVFHDDRFPDDPWATEIKRRHILPEYWNIPDAFQVFASLGYTLDVIDIANDRGVERLVDLNKALSSDIEEYDLVLDHGTIEHCFNIAQAAINLAGLVKEGGYIVQSLPMNMFNHGFYNINPTWFFSFYPASGFEITHFECSAGNVPAHQRFRLTTTERAMLICVAKRCKKQALDKDIAQFKYAQH